MPAPRFNDVHVTVLIPAYNRAKYIKHAVKSVCYQTYKDWDLLVVDDGSTDDTELEAVKAAEGHAITVVSIEHGGCAKATRVGIEHASGPLISILDSDDTLFAEALETVVPPFEADENLAYLWTNLIKSTGELGPGQSLPEGKTLYEALKGGWWACSAQRVFRKSFYLKTSGIDITIPKAVDLQLAFLMSISGGKSLHIPKVTYWYRQHDGQMSIDLNKEQYACDKKLRRKF